MTGHPVRNDLVRIDSSLHQTNPDDDTCVLAVRPLRTDDGHPGDARERVR
jgi:hypothetical protein